MQTERSPETRDHSDQLPEYDYIIIGSGFGGSVSAMRLSQKGYRVAVLESGKRWDAKDFPKTNWNVRKFLWFPKVFCYGIQRINLLNDVMILSGSGVGGGSLVYANTLYVPKKQFFNHPTVKQLGGEKSLMPYYDLARRMLGVVENPRTWEVDDHMQATAEEMGFGDTFTTTPVGVYFGDPDKKKDPYFGGEGPERFGCNYCGGCMVGCRFHAKNTLDKNYLYFAEKLGATVYPETRVVDVIPQGVDGSDGYIIKTDSPTGWFGYPRRTFRARGVIFSAGVLGTVNLLSRLKQSGRLPHLSEELGNRARTNSESIIGVTVPGKHADFSRGIAITSSVHPDDHTHIEPVRYSKGSDVMGMLATVMVDGGGPIPRALKFIGTVFRHPLQYLRTLWPIGFAQKSIILLVMQTLDDSLKLVRRRRWIWPFTRSLTSAEGEVPTYIPVANQFARKLANRIGGIPQSSYNEVLLDVPVTAHILGGCCIGATPSDGVIDLENRVHGYKNMYVCDGSVIPANPGVNPSLSITAFSERAMALIPPKSMINVFSFEKKWKVQQLLATRSVGSRTSRTGTGGSRTSGVSRKKSKTTPRKKTNQAAGSSNKKKSKARAGSRKKAARR